MFSVSAFVNNAIKKSSASLKNYEKSLKEQYVIYIRENYSKKDVNDILKAIKKVDKFYKM